MFNRAQSRRNRFCLVWLAGRSSAKKEETSCLNHHQSESAAVQNESYGIFIIEREQSSKTMREKRGTNKRKRAVFVCVRVRVVVVASA